MRKWPLLIPNAIAASCLPFICLTSCNNNEQEKKKVPPESIEIWYGDHRTTSKTMYEGDTLDFYAKVLPEEAEQKVVFESSNPSVIKFDKNNKAIPTGLGVANVTAHPVGYPGFQSTGIQITVDKIEDYTKVDTSHVVINEPIIAGLSSSYGISLSNFKVNFSIAFEHLVTAKIHWVSQETMDDDAAGIKTTKLDSFLNTWFDVICTFKPSQPIEVGHKFQFSLEFYFEQSDEPFFETEIYSVIYTGESKLVIDDSEVTNVLDFNHGDYLHTTLSGFKTNFDFGMGTTYELSIRCDEFYTVLNFDIVKKHKEGDWIKFDLNVTSERWTDNDVFTVKDEVLIFFINNVEVFITRIYKVLPIDMVKLDTTTILDIQKEGNTPKLLITGFQTNFDFSTELWNSSLLTIYIQSFDDKNIPASYSIIKTGDRTFDVEILWEEDTDFFDQTPFVIHYFLDNHELYLNKLITAKYTKNAISFTGKNNIRIGYDNNEKKYVSALRGFVHNFATNDDLISIDLNLNEPNITQPTIEYRMDNTYGFISWILYLYWDEADKPDFSQGPIGGNVDISYNGELLLDDLRFTISEPRDDDYYDILLETSDGQMDIIKNTKEEDIEIGIKDIDLTQKELCGYYVYVNGMDYTTGISTYDFNPTGEYKIKISIQLSALYRAISPADEIKVGTIFTDNSVNTINLTEESQFKYSSYDFPSLQTKDLVDLKKDETYCINVDFSNLDAIQDLPFLDQALFVCGSDPTDLSTWYDLNEPFYAIWAKQSIGCFSLPKTKQLLMYSIMSICDTRKAHITIVWKPDRDINDVHLAIGASAT